MSPLPELVKHFTSYNSDSGRFFEENLSANDRSLLILMPGYKEEEIFRYFKWLNVNFKDPLEKYTTDNKEDGDVDLHHVYSTSKKGVYLELIFKNKDLGAVDNLKSILSVGKQICVHKLSEKTNEEYLVSITNG